MRHLVYFQPSGDSAQGEGENPLCNKAIVLTNNNNYVSEVHSH